MGEADRRTDIVLLMERYSEDGRKLFDSLKLANYNAKAVVIDDDGFLPEDAISVYEYFLGDFKAAGEAFVSAGGINANIKEKSIPGHPRYFNQIEKPEYWEINANNSDGKIMDKSHERGHIFYAEPKHKRLVSIVEWYDGKGTVRVSDHYNKYGALYARTIFNAKGQRVSKSYFSTDKVEIIVENFVTNDIMLNTDKGLCFFRSKSDFVAYFLKESGLANQRIAYNSLSVPFFATLQLEENGNGDMLFWQENTGNDIPGNMKYILDGNAKRCSKVFVQKIESFNKLMELGASPEKVKYLGNIYKFKRQNEYRRRALICTNSDKIMQLDKIVEAFEDVHFNIAALTEMSSKLLDFDKYENVSLYPGVKPAMQDSLFEDCDIYLDINRESEIISAVQNAFLNNMLVLGFEEVAHNRDYVAGEYLFAEKDTDKLIKTMETVLDDRAAMDEALKKQRDAALIETAEKYIEVIG